MNKTSIISIAFLHRQGSRRAEEWVEKIEKWRKGKYPTVKTVKESPDVLIVLGGDGTILDAARTYAGTKTLVLGLNLGRVGFLSSVRSPDEFLPGLELLFKDEYHVVERPLFVAALGRGGKETKTVEALNDVVVTSPLGMVRLDVAIEGQLLQQIRGTGVLVASSSGSTAYNLSLHGPVVMPDLPAFIVTELADHNTPTPSVVLRNDKTITITVSDFRKREMLTMTESGEKFDVLLIADGKPVSALQEGDIITITRSERSARFIEFEDHYFLKSLQEQFSFR